MSLRHTPRRILISERAAQAIDSAAVAAYPTETGGLLLGVHAQAGPWITVALVVQPESAGIAHYRIPRGVTPALVEEARAGDPRLGYLGDWHSHPTDTGPSGVDRNTTRRTAERLRSPVLLLVARPRRDSYFLDAYEGTRWRITSRLLVTTGDLPSEP
ncbi:Mov34/MPN/PAD-1 family protein [Agrococcus sediminis]|uniref:Mov34/MPN/PAD-1 family protein n=1 Tax=Agrococcus sediminis TaxID=2599924 RepID=UPI00341699B5